MPTASRDTRTPTMPTVEDSISDEEVQDVEQAKREAKRERTKYGTGVTGSKLDTPTEDDDE